MNGVNILKINEEMWLEIESGKKVVEVRKLNKDYIQVGNDICFIDVDTNEILGEKWCIGKLYSKPNDIGYTIKHKPTIDFVNKNYWEEPYVILFALGEH